MQDMWVQSLGGEDPLEEGMATHSNILAWRMNPHGQRSLEGYSPWGQKEPDTTEQLSTHASIKPISLLSGTDTLVLLCPVSASMGS